MPFGFRVSCRRPIRGWCNWQHTGFWSRRWGFESSPPSCRPKLSAASDPMPDQLWAPSSSGPGRRPLKAVTPVQIRSGLLAETPTQHGFPRDWRDRPQVSWDTPGTHRSRGSCGEQPLGPGESGVRRPRSGQSGHAGLLTGWLRRRRLPRCRWRGGRAIRGRGRSASSCGGRHGRPPLERRGGPQRRRGRR